jgi:hypothetical protein
VLANTAGALAGATLPFLRSAQSPA